MGVSTRKSKATSPKNARPEKRGHGSVRQKKKTKIQAKKAAFREKLKVEHASNASGKTQMKKKKRNKKKYTALNDMKSLAETLGDFGQHDSLAMKVTTVKTAKQRDRILQEEKERMSQVYGHPVFQSDPLKAVLGHLEATLPPPPE
ncbi:hypothetical protein M9435_000462 [Picochlorum sp. BPE23]|nr:hypothetical protein M9435_000462 [Picochlorum sp. BPE23]